MADDFGRIHPVSQRFLNRDKREEPYSGKQSRKHAVRQADGASDKEAAAEDESVEPAGGNLIDLRI